MASKDPRALPSGVVGSAKFESAVRISTGPLIQTLADRLELFDTAKPLKRVHEDQVDLDDAKLDVLQHLLILHALPLVAPALGVIAVDFHKLPSVAQLTQTALDFIELLIRAALV